MEFYLTIFLFAVSSTITPGPNNIMIMTSSLNHGIRNSIPHFLGICLGFPLMVVLLGLGLSVIFERYPVIHEVIKVLGIIYLLYLAWKVATSSSSFKGEKSKPFSFIQAALFQWVNPKAWVMATGAVATFTTLSAALFPQVIVIALIFLMVAFPAVGLWMVFGAGLSRYLRSELHQRLFNISMALLLVASLIPVLMDLYSSIIS